MINLKKIIEIYEFLLGFSWGCCSSAALLDESLLAQMLKVIDRKGINSETASLLVKQMELVTAYDIIMVCKSKFIE